METSFSLKKNLQFENAQTETKFCKKCNSYLEKSNFHKSKNRSYPDGYITT